MGKLTRRIEALEKRRPTPDTCAEHVGLAGARPFDIREGLQAFSPDPAERAAYHERMDRLEAQPPCTRCGWKPFVVRVVAAETWGWGPHDEPVT